MFEGDGGRRWATALLGMGVAVTGAAAAYAQTAAQTQTAGTREQLNPGGQIAAKTRRPADIFAGPIQSPCPPQFIQSTAHLTLEGVDVSGTKVLAADQITHAYQDLIGRPVPISAACDIRDRVANLLFRRGILARVEIPAQRLPATGGRLQLVVIEAQITSVRYHAQGDVGPAQGKVEAYLDRLRGLAPFDLDTAQRYLLLANEVPGMQVSAALLPSSGPNGPVRGGIDLDVVIRRKAFDLVGAVQNNSSEALGPWNGIARVDLNSFTGLGERTTLIGYTALNRDEQQVVQVMEEIRPGATGLSLRGSIAYGLSHPGGVLEPLKLNGRSVIGTGEVDYPFIYLTRKKLTLAGGFDWIDQNTDFPGGGALSDDSLRVFWARADAFGRHDFSAPTPLGYVSTVGTLSLQARKGVLGLGASTPGAAALSRPEGRPDAVVVRADGMGTLSFQPVDGGPLGFNLSLHFQGQYADRPLLAYEEQAIGNLTIGRGYDPNALSGDRVIAVEFKAQTAPLVFAPGFSIAPYGFLDQAKVSNLDQGSVDQTVRSLGGGAEFRLFYGNPWVPYGLHADVVYAQPLDKTFVNSPGKPPPRVLLQLIAAY